MCWTCQCVRAAEVCTAVGLGEMKYTDYFALNVFDSNVSLFECICDENKRLIIRSRSGSQGDKIINRIDAVLDYLIALLDELGTFSLVRTPIAALALHRAIGNASTAVAALHSIGDLTLQFGTEMARFESRS